MRIQTEHTIVKKEQTFTGKWKKLTGTLQEIEKTHQETYCNKAAGTSKQGFYKGLWLANANNRFRRAVKQGGFFNT